MTRRLFVLTVFAALIISSIAPSQTRSAGNGPVAQDHIAWVSQALQKMQTIKPGMTRLELLQVFTTEGGLSSGLHRRFVSRDCPYFKVDVEFKPAPRPDFNTFKVLNSVEDNRDTIIKISEPYLQFSITD
jgi:hypothetical protein